MSHARTGRSLGGSSAAQASEPAYVPRRSTADELFGAGRGHGVEAGRQAAAAQIDRSMKAWRKARGGGAAAEIAQKSGGGSALSSSVRRRMEPRLGADLSAVRVHDDGGAAADASALNARAFTVGNDVHFNSGEYAPGSKDGDRLLAHELQHVVQSQRGGIQRKADDDEVSQPEEPAEQEADHVADGVAEDLHGEGAEEDQSGGKKKKVEDDPARAKAEEPEKKQDGEGEGKGDHEAGGAAEASAAPAAAAPVARKIMREEKKEESKNEGGVSLSKDHGSISLAHKLGSKDVSYFTFELELEGTVGYQKEAAGGEGGGEGGGGAETSVGATKGEDGVGVGVGIEKEFEDDKVMDCTPHVNGGFSVDEKGPHVSLGMSLETPKIGSWHGFDLGPVEIGGPSVTWGPENPVPDITLASVEIPVTLPKAHLMGYELSATIAPKLSIKPNLKKIAEELAKQVAEQLGTTIGTAAACVILPIAAFCAEMYIFGKSGHEFDADYARVKLLHDTCKEIAAEAMGKPHEVVAVPGIIDDCNADVVPVVADVQQKLADQLKVPVGAIPKAGKHDHGLRETAYQLAWGDQAPKVKAAIMAQYQDTTWSNYSFERSVIEAYFSGGLSHDADPEE